MMVKIGQFVSTDIWRIRSGELPWAKSVWIRLLRIIILSVRGYDKDHCGFRASALTFYTLLSIVPVVAMAFGIAKGFGFETALEELVYRVFQGQNEVALRVMNFARSLLENAKGGVIAGVGLLLLFWTIIRVLGNIETSFNQIWGIKKPRSVTRKISDYLAAMFVCPLLFILSSSVTVVIKSEVALGVQKITLLGAVGPAIFFSLKLLPYCVIWILFSFVYMFMPNAKINFKSGLLAGIVAGTLYQIFQLVYLSFQIGVAKYNAIYGSFAVLPLFLIWLQVSWLIVLFGAEISFAHQNVDSYEFEPDCLRVSAAYKKLLSLQISHLVIRNFSKGEKPLTALQISQTSGIPIRLVGQILQELIESGIFSGTQSQEPGELGYLPARDISILTIKYILEALEDRGANNMLVAQTKELNVLSEALQAFRDVIGRCPANRLLKDI